MYMQLYKNTPESNLLPVSGSAVEVLTCTPNKYRELQQGHVTDLTTLARCLPGFASRSVKRKTPIRTGLFDGVRLRRK